MTSISCSIAVLFIGHNLKGYCEVHCFLKVTAECLTSTASVEVMRDSGVNDLTRSDAGPAIGRPCEPPGWQRPGRRRVGSLVHRAAGRPEGSPASCPGRTARGTSGPWRRSKISAVCTWRTRCYHKNIQ